MVEKVSEQESDEYYAVRPRSSQIGAWSSQQSRPINGRAYLEAALAANIARFEGVAELSRPKHWGGWRLRPRVIEFWKGREARLHDRIVYTCKEDMNDEECEWKMGRLQP